MKTFWKVAIILVFLTFAVLFGFKKVLGWYLRPPSDFAISDIPAAPDYAELSAWASHPEMPDAADLAPDGIEPADPGMAAVDVFYIHPTSYFGPGGWNAEISSDQSAAQGIEHMLATQASVFSSCCRVYAPHYRQAHLQSFIDRDTDAGFRALDLAYSDVETAFTYFLEHLNDGRPYIIASHSQGTAHAVRLLKKHVDGTELRQRMIAAYLVGYWLPKDLLSRTFKDIGVCTSADMFGCFVTYDTYDSEGPGRLPDTGVPHWYEEGWEWSDNKETLCVNPLSWRSDLQFVSRDQNLGALPMHLNFSLVDLLLNRNAGFKYDQLDPVMAGQTSAACREDGSLLIDSQVDNEFSEPGSGEDRSYHVFDWNFFYMNIRENVTDRIASFHRAMAKGQ